MTKSTSAPAFTLPGADKSHTFTLAEPITRENGNAITQLTIRKPRAGELRGLSIKDLVVGDVDTIIALLPRIAMPTIAAHEAAALESEDIAEAAGAISGFLTNRAPAKEAEVA